MNPLFMESERTKLGHYEIVGAIGAGGMGEIYAARDPKLGRKVAIKKLPQRLAGDRETLTRFTQEARSASALNHPNIVTIHEVGADHDVPFIVMEFIDGSDLRSLINSGALSVRRALDIAVQIADGLSAAHERGIVHRDLKPENIMVTHDGFAKILDFGLAKMTSPGLAGDITAPLEVPGTTPGTILGTVGYMSPEQATGRLIDFRSDQFAFGAIVYELVTGVPAFRGENAIDTLSAILHHDPPPITRTNSRAPSQLTGIVRRLLEKSPEDRYASTRDLAKELRLLRERVIAEESGMREASVPRSRRTVAFAIAAVVVVAIATGATLYYSGDGATVHAAGATTSRASATDPRPKHLAVMRFKDLTGEDRGQLVVDGFAETLAARLASYPSVQVTSARLGEHETADVRTVARKTGSDLVLGGSMLREGERIRVTWRLVDATTGREWQNLVEGTASDLFAIQDRLATSIAETLDLRETGSRRSIPSPASQERYLEALGLLRNYASTEAVDEAIAILRTQGASPPVRAALARAYLHKFQSRRDPSFAADAIRFADLALRADPQNIEVNVTLGQLHRMTARYEEATEAYMRVLSQQPNNVDAVLGIADTYKDGGDNVRAEAAYKRAIALQPNYWATYNRLGFFYYVTGRPREAIPQFEKVVALDGARGRLNLGGMYQLMGRYDEAARLFRESIAQNPTGQGYSNLGTTLYFLGRYAESAEAFRKAMELEPADHSYHRNLGDALRWAPGRREEATAAYERAIVLARDTLDVNPGDAYAYSTLAVSYAKTGRHSEARRAILRALELSPKNPTMLYDAGVIATLAGAHDEAVARLEQALRLDQAPSDILRDPELANLRESGRLDAVLQSATKN